MLTQTQLIAIIGGFLLANLLANIVFPFLLGGEIGARLVRFFCGGLKTLAKGGSQEAEEMALLMLRASGKLQDEIRVIAWHHPADDEDETDAAPPPELCSLAFEADMGRLERRTITVVADRSAAFTELTISEHYCDPGQCTILQITVNGNPNLGGPLRGDLLRRSGSLKYKDYLFPFVVNKGSTVVMTVQNLSESKPLIFRAQFSGQVADL